LASDAPELEGTVAAYRAGYTPQQRRELEHRLTNGDLRAVVTTDALELGIDIGSLDAAVVVTFPGTVASLRQMWGRAGRRGRGLPGRARLAAIRSAGLVRDRRAAVGRDARHGRGRARLHDRARGRDLPAPGPFL